jgi:uncharacterized Zn finger protein (UPF0148 family)
MAKFCPECGASAEGAKFCPECGHALNGEARPTQAATALVEEEEREVWSGKPSSQLAPLNVRAFEERVRTDAFAFRHRAGCASR